MRAFAVALIVLVACGGAQQSVDISGKLAKENQITALWTQIRDWRREGHMPLDPPQNMLFEYRNQSVKQAARACPDGHEVPQVCNDVCSIADDICDNAEAICNIAAELGPNDEYAQEKCASAKASCRDAKQRCCGCSKSSSQPAAPPEGM